jgi:Transposase DDE domain
MHNIASSFDSEWLDVLDRLPADLHLEPLARETKALLRRREITAASDLLRLGLAHGPGGMSLPQTAAWAHLSGICELSAPSLSDRLHQSVAFFAAIVRRLLEARPLSPASPWHGRCLKLHASSSLSQPGSKGTNWRIHAVYDLGSASFSHLELTDEKGAETLTHAPVEEGSIAIADRGYARAADMAGFLKPYGVRTGDFIVRIGWNSLRLENLDGSPFDLIALLNEMAEQAIAPDNPTPREWSGLALYGRGKRIRKLPLRLAIVPLPPEKAEIARKKIRRTASKQQTKLNPKTLLAAGFLMLATSLAADFPAADICAVYRLRWQIELAFKRLKSLIRVDRLPTRTDAGGRSWIYPHLILALLTEDICQEILESSPSGPCQGGYPSVSLADPEVYHRYDARGFGYRTAFAHGFAQGRFSDPRTARKSPTKAETANAIPLGGLNLMPMRLDRAI